MLLFISPVNHCNLSCTFCPGARYDLREVFMEQGLLEKVVEEVQRFGYNRDILYGEFGEQFLHPNNLDFIRFLKASGFTFSQFFTNATLLDAAGISALMSILDERDLLITHLDWGKAFYERHRRGPVYDRVRHNVVEMIRAPRRLCRLRIGSIAGRFEDGRPVGIPGGQTERYREEVREIMKEAGCDASVYLNIEHAPTRVTFFTRPLSNWSNLLYDSGRPWKCMGVDQMHILADGRVSLCCHDWLGETEIGNVNRQSLEEIWEGEARRTLVDSILSRTVDRAICRGCLCIS